MLKQISSMQTFIFKVIFPCVWIGGFGLGTFVVWFGEVHTRHGEQAPEDMRLPFLFAWIAGSTFILWIALRLKRVSVDSTNIYVSNYLKEISTPLTNISGVTENRWINIHPVTIHLRKPTAFGREITFMPTIRFFALWSSHPIVAELRRLGKARVGGT
jgi:hypothetical protein